jgi:hypothetical protein
MMTPWRPLGKAERKAEPAAVPFGTLAGMSAPPPRQPAPPAIRPDLLPAVLLSCSLAVFVCYVSNNLHPRFEHRSETIAEQVAVLAGESYPINGVPTYFSVFQNRVIFPLALAATTGVTGRLGLGGIGQWYLLVRLGAACCAFLIFWYLLRRVARAEPVIAGAGMGLLAYELVFTFNHGWEVTSDFPDVAFTALMLWATLTHRRWSLLLVAVLASFNRESSIFAGVIWLFLHGIGPRWRLRLPEIAFSLLLIVVSYATVLGVRWWFGGAKALSAVNLEYGSSSWGRLVEAVDAVLKQPSLSSWPVLLLAAVTVPGLWLYRNRDRLGAQLRRLVLLAGVLFLLSVVFGTPNELRIYMTSLVVLAYVATAGEATRTAVAPAAPLPGLPRPPEVLAGAAAGGGRR